MSRQGLGYSEGTGPGLHAWRSARPEQSSSVCQLLHFRVPRLLERKVRDAASSAQVVADTVGAGKGAHQGGGRRAEGAEARAGRQGRRGRKKRAREALKASSPRGARTTRRAQRHGRRGRVSRDGRPVSPASERWPLRAPCRLWEPLLTAQQPHRDGPRQGGAALRPGQGGSVQRGLCPLDERAQGWAGGVLEGQVPEGSVWGQSRRRG